MACGATAGGCPAAKNCRQSWKAACAEAVLAALLAGAAVGLGDALPKQAESNAAPTMDAATARALRAENF